MREFTLDGKPMRFALFAFAPMLMCIATFACEVLVGSIVSTSYAVAAQFKI